MIYIGLAVLLGSVTMVIPIILLSTTNPSLGINNFDGPPEIGSNDSERTYQNGVSIESNDSLTAPDSKPYPVEVEENKLTFGETELSSSLSSIGWITVPSFLFALGFFIFIRRRIS